VGAGGYVRVRIVCELSRASNHARTANDK